MGGILPKMGEFCTFSRLNISVIFNDRASLIITDIQKLIPCLSKKHFFNDLDLQYQGQIAHASSIALFCQTGQQDCLQTRSKLTKTYKILLYSKFLLKIIEIFFHFGGKGVKFRTSQPLKRHTYSIQGIKTFKKTQLPLLDNTYCKDIWK